MEAVAERTVRVASGQPKRIQLCAGVCLDKGCEWCELVLGFLARSFVIAYIAGPSLGDDGSDAAQAGRQEPQPRRRCLDFDAIESQKPAVDRSIQSVD